MNLDCFDKFPELETKRLHLRQVKDEDAEVILKMRADERVGQFLGRESMEGLDKAKELVDKMKKAYSDKQAIAWMGFTKDTNAFIGACGLNRIEIPNKRAELGGEMDVSGWGRRYSFEAVKAIVDYGIDEMKLHSIEAQMNADNRSAIYLVEQLGFEKEGHLKDRYFFKDKYHDLVYYTLFSEF